MIEIGSGLAKMPIVVPMIEKRRTHGSHHSYCAECLEGPQPALARPTVQRSTQPGAEWSEAAGLAVQAALELPPTVAAAKPHDNAERGLEIVFASVDAAAYARTEINRALAETEWAGRAGAWLWQEASSTGTALTRAGAATGFEIRLQPYSS
jgi:hypothetical protein